MKSIERNIRLYSLFSLFNEPLFWGPILITTLQQLGHMTLSAVYTMESQVVLICVLLDIPSGALADIIGRKKILIIGRIFLLLSSIGFATMSSPFMAWAANILWAIGYSFQSGADSSLLAESLTKLGRRDEFKKIQGKALGGRFLTMAFCSLIVGWLASFNMRLPLFVSIPFVIIPLVCSFFFTDLRVSERYSAKKQKEKMLAGIKYAIQKPQVRWIVGFSALIGGASKIWFFTYNPYFEIVHIKLEQYGFVFCLLNIVAWFCSHYAKEIETKLKEEWCIILMVLCIGVPIILMAYVPIWPFAYLVLCQNIVRGFSVPFFDDFVQKHIHSDDVRATVSSVRSSTSNVISFFTLMSFGILLKHDGVLGSLKVLGMIAIALGAVCYWRYSVLLKKEQHMKES